MCAGFFWTKKTEQNSVSFHRSPLKERGLRPNGYFPLMRQPFCVAPRRDLWWRSSGQKQAGFDKGKLYAIGDKAIMDYATAGWYRLKIDFPTIWNAIDGSGLGSCSAFQVVSLPKIKYTRNNKCGIDENTDFLKGVRRNEGYHKKANCDRRGGF